MKRLLLILAVFLLPAVAKADVFPYQNWCQYGGQTVSTQGLTSTTKVQQSFPGCNVEVFVTGTGTHASLFSDSGGTSPIGNPFQANTSTGFFFFYTAVGCYDIVTSGGSLPASHTDTVCLATSASAGTVTSVTATNNAGALISVGVTNPTTTPVMTFGLVNFGPHLFYGNNTGSTGTPAASVIGTADLPFTYSGNTTKLLTGGTISGTAAPLCTDASGNATTSGCPSAGGAGYQTVQDEGVGLTQRNTINCVGAGITCSDDSGSGTTVFTVTANLSGSGTVGHIPQFDSTNSITDTDFTYVGGQLSRAQTGVTLSVTTPQNNSGNGGNVSILSGPSTSGNGGNVNIHPGVGSLQGGNIILNPAKGTTTNGIISCIGDSSLNAGGCSFVMKSSSDDGGGSVVFTVGHGVPSGNCQSTKVNPQVTGIPVLYLRDDPASISGLLYGCLSNVWTPIPAAYSATATLDFGNLASIGCEDLTMTVTGAAVGDTVALGVPNGSVPSATFTFTAWVSSANTVTIRGCTLVSGDPASGTFKATVFK